GPILATLGGAAAGGAVGGLVGGTGAFRPIHLPEEIADRIQHEVTQGNILIAVHSEDPEKLSQALSIFRMEDAEEIYDSRQEAAWTRCVEGGPDCRGSRSPAVESMN